MQHKFQKQVFCTSSQIILLHFFLSPFNWIFVSGDCTKMYRVESNAYVEQVTEILWSKLLQYICTVQGILYKINSGTSITYMFHEFQLNPYRLVRFGMQTPQQPYVFGANNFSFDRHRSQYKYVCTPLFFFATK